MSRRAWLVCLVATGLDVASLAVLTQRPSFSVALAAATGAFVASTVVFLLLAYRLLLSKNWQFASQVLSGPVVVPVIGAVTFSSAGPRTMLHIELGRVSPAFFATLGSVAFAVTLAFMVEMRSAGQLPRDYERVRRRTMRSLAVGGAVATGCAIAGVCLAPRSSVLPAPAQPSDIVAGLLGAAAYGTFLVGSLLVVLAAVPREGFEAEAIEEDSRLRSDARRRYRLPRHYLRRAGPATLTAVLLLGGALAASWLALPALLLASVGLRRAARPRGRNPRADRGMPVHPLTFLSVVVAGLSLMLIGHWAFPSLPPAATPAAGDLYGVCASFLASGYVVFAAGRPRQWRSGLLPSMHTIAVWCAIAAFAGLGLAGSLVGAARAGGWFPFWATAVSLPAMLGQLLVARSVLVR